jgi:DNA-binding MarR family transcriptional regulator
MRSPLSQSELADVLSVSGASMVHMIDRLVKAGLVIREPSISDRRVNRIVITDAGHRIYADLKYEAAAVRQQLLSSIELESLAHLTELLEQLLVTLPCHAGRESERGCARLALDGAAKVEASRPTDGGPRACS